MSITVAAAALVVRRTIAATPEDLFDAWLDPDALGTWMRPTGIRATEAQVDARVGGRYEITMHGEAKVHSHTGEYRLIDRPRKLIFTWRSEATREDDTLVTVDFRRVDRRTEVVITHERLPEGAHEAHNAGWSSALERLSVVKGSREPALAAQRAPFAENSPAPPK